MERLIFKIDSDQQSQDEEQKQKNKDEKVNNIKQIKNNGNKEMKNNQQLNKKVNKQILLNKFLSKNQSIFRKKIQRYNNQQQQQQQQQTQSIKDVYIEPKFSKKQQKISIFQDDDRLTKNSNNNLSQLQNKSKITQSTRTIVKNPQDVNKSQLIQNHTKLSKQLQNHKSQFKNSLSTIWEPSEKVLQDTFALSSKLVTQSDPLHIHNFLMTPLQRGKAFQFEVQKFKNFMSTEYFFCLQHGTTLKYIAHAISNPLQFEKSAYTISLKVQNSLQSELDIRRPNRFIGYLISNFKRSKYTLYDHQNYSNIDGNVKILCTVASIPNFLEVRIRRNDLYILKKQKNKSNVIYNNTISSNLKKLYKIPETSHQISKLTTHLIPTQQLQKLGKQYSIKKNTTRNAVIKDENKIPIFFIVKIQNNCFKLRVYGSITPIEIFSYVIVHLQ